MNNPSLELEENHVFLEDMSKIIDDNFINNNVEWVNHGGKLTVFHNDKKNDWVYFNNETNEIKSFCFNKVVCSGFHGFGGTIYDYNFFLDDKPTEYCVGRYKFAPNSEKLKEIKIKEINYEIQRIDNLIKYKSELQNKIELIKVL